jgi:hypothetical protein
MFLKEHGLSFEAIVKPNRPENDERGFGTVNAQVDAWGTKWDLADDEKKEAGDCLLKGGVDFHTAWSPPSEAIRALSELTGASFELAFYEPGEWFWGKESINDGEISTDIDSGSESTKEELKDFLMQEMGYSPSDAHDEAGLNEDEEEEQVERLKDEKRGLYPESFDIAN